MSLIMPGRKSYFPQETGTGESRPPVRLSQGAIPVTVQRESHIPEWLLEAKTEMVDKGELAWADRLLGKQLGEPT